MGKSFVGNVLLYSTLTWLWLLFAMSPMLAFVWFFQNYHPGLITSFNLFLVSMIGTIGFVYLLSPLLSALAPPKLELKHSQWEFAFEVIKWLKAHEATCATIMMSGLLAVFVPMEFIWVWLNSVGLLASAFQAFVFLFALVLPFFLIPAHFISCLYDSVVRPRKISGITQLSRIIDALYSKPECTGEALEAAKRRSVSIPNKRIKLLAASLLASVVLELVLLQLIELRYVSQQVEIILPFAMAAQMVVLFIVMSVGGEKKTELDLWIDRDKKTESGRPKPKQKQHAGQFGLSLRKSIGIAGKTIANIERNWFYRLLTIIGIVMSLILTVLELLRLI